MTRRELVLILGAVGGPVFTWAALGFLRKLPSWLLTLETSTLVGAFAYTQTFALAESVILTLVLAGIGGLLPRRWFPAGYVAFACGLGIAGGICMALLHLLVLMQLRGVGDLELLGAGLLLALVALGVAVTSARLDGMARTTQLLADRLALLLWIYVPLSLASLAIVIARNISR